MGFKTPRDRFTQRGQTHLLDQDLLDVFAKAAARCVPFALDQVLPLLSAAINRDRRTQAIREA